MCSGSEVGREDIVCDEEQSSPAPSNPETEDSSTPRSPKAALPEKLRSMDGRTSGGGLTAEELQELHKTDPKKVKRILANRSSAARSKVRKLRYIAELDSKSASLHQQVTGMTAEMRVLQEGTSRLGAENEWLFSQVVELQERSLRLDHENDALESHIRQSRHLSRVLSNPPAPSNTLTCEPQARLPHNLSPETLPPAGRLQIPTSAFQAALQDPGYQSLLISPRTALSPNNPSEVQAHMSDLATALNPHMTDHSLPFGTDMPLPGAALQSHHSSEGSGMSSTTQELRLGPEDPALLEMLRSFDLGSMRSGHVPLPPNSLARYDRSLSLGMPPRRKDPTLQEAQLQQRLSDLGLAFQPWPNLSNPEDSRLLTRPWPQQASLPLQDPPAPSLAQAYGFGGLAAPPLPQGLQRWPRAFSDPQAFNRGPYAQ